MHIHLNKCPYDAQGKTCICGAFESFEDFLNEKFFAENPMTLDDDWPDAYSDWLADQDCDTLVKYGQEYANNRLERYDKG